jgi:methyl-accepting chemotaxis protein
MKNKIIKSLLVTAIVVPSVSFAFLSDVNDGLKKVSNTANATANVADNAQNLNAKKYATSKIDQSTNGAISKTKAATDNAKNFNAKNYAAAKIDQNTNGSISKTKETSDNLNQTKNDLKETGKSMSKLFS